MAGAIVIATVAAPVFCRLLDFRGCYEAGRAVNMEMEVDAFLCDSIASAEGKLYVQGAGWNTIFSARFPARHARIGIGVLIGVPYTATNEPHEFEVRLEDSDGRRLPIVEAPPGVTSEDGRLYAIGGEFNMGRPPLLPAGDSQMVPLAMNVDGLVFDRPDAYNFVISIDGTEMKRLPIRLQQLAQPGPLAPR